MKLEMPMIESERLLLRPVEVEDVADVFAIYGDHRVLDGNTGVHVYDHIDDMLKVLKNEFLAYRERFVPQSMVMELKDDGKVIGIIDYHTIKGDVGEMGYMLNYDYWGHGYMQEAVAIMLYLGFEHLGLRRIEADYAPHNQKSGRVLEANGFVVEGRLRKAVMLNDHQYHDLILCSILKEEYEQKKNYNIINLEGEQEHEERISSEV